MLAGSTWEKVERNAVVRYEMCRTTMQDHQRVAAEAGVSHLIVQKGQLRLYRDKSEYLAGKRVWELRRRMGCKFTELEAEALHRLEPSVSDRYRFAILQEGGGIRTEGRGQTLDCACPGSRRLGSLDRTVRMLRRV